MAIGERGVIVLSDDNGQTWHQAEVPASLTLTAVSFPTPNDGWAVGHGGLVLHSSDGGQKWVRQIDGANEAKLELDAAKTAFAQDPRAEARLKDATRAVAEGPDTPLLAVHFWDAMHGMVIGAYGRLLTTQDGGQRWRSQPDLIDNPKERHLYGLFVDGTHVLIAGEQGSLYRSDDNGSSFKTVQMPYTGTFFGVTGRIDHEIVVYGLRGNAFASTDGGSTWAKADPALPSTLTAGIQLDDGSILLTDESGQVMRSNASGTAFRPMPIPLPFSFTGAVVAKDGALVLTGIRGALRLPSTIFASPRS